MARTVYAVHMIRPIQGLMMGFSRDIREDLPHNSGKNTVIFESRQDALAYLDAAAMDPKYLTQMTATPCGKQFNQIAQMGRPGILLQMACPESTLETLHAEPNKYTGTPAYTAPITGMFLENMMVRIPEDWLHHKGDFSLAELADEMHVRYEDFENLERTLSASPVAMLSRINPETESTRADLRFVYGENGLINANFKTTDPTLDELRFMQQVMHKHNVGISYMMQMQAVEGIYKGLVAEDISKGVTPKAARESAVEVVASGFNTLAMYYEDKQAMANTFKGFMDGKASAEVVEDHDEHNFVTPGDDEPDIFE